MIASPLLVFAFPINVQIFYFTRRFLSEPVPSCATLGVGDEGGGRWRRHVFVGDGTVGVEVWDLSLD